MPYPHNYETATAVEGIISSNGCVPATIALLDGKVHIGLDNKQLMRLSDIDPTVLKTSRRDISYVLSQGLSGGTTVASTMFLAHKAGIPIFCTGGIGGVHRGAESTMDISADLTELGRTPVAVVCAGAKSILDIGRTLEYLETQGVPVATLGPTNDFPAFYAPKSGFKSPMHLKTPDAVASLIYQQHELGNQTGIVVATPIPDEHAATGRMMQDAIDQALREAIERGVAGKETTPFLLQRIGELTKGTSLVSNIALVKNNALASSQIARRYNEMRYGKVAPNHQPAVPRTLTSILKSSETPFTTRLQNQQISSDCVVFGGAIVDMTMQYRGPSLGGVAAYLGSTFASSALNKTAGGVGRNIAEAAHRLGIDATFIGAIGEDENGQYLQDWHQTIGLKSAWHIEKSNSTATAMLLLDPKGDLISGAIHADILEALSESDLPILTDKVKLAVIDGNSTSNAIRAIVRYCAENNVPALFEPTSVLKSSRIIDPQLLTAGRSAVTYITPNVYELRAMFDKAIALGMFDDVEWRDRLETMGIAADYRQEADQFILRHPHLNYLRDQGILQQSIHLLPYIPNHIITLGKDGILLVELRDHRATEEKSNSGWIINGLNNVSTRWTYVPAEAIDSSEVISTTGAGDSLTGAIAAALTKGLPLDKVLGQCQKAAIESLKSKLAISERLSPGLLGSI